MYISVIVKRYYPFDVICVSRNVIFLVSLAAALKTQPYDLLRWSAAYFRCLSLDVLPPVKPRYEHENVFGCLTKGYLKVLLSQVSSGYGETFGFSVVMFHIYVFNQIQALPFTPYTS